MAILRRQMRPSNRQIASMAFVKDLSGKQPHKSPNKCVLFADKTYLDPKMTANKFVHQFTPPPIRLNIRHALHSQRSPRHCCRLLKKKAASPNSSRRARSDSCIRQCGPSTTAPLCLQHQLTGNNPSLAQQLYAEHTSQSSFSAKRIQELKGENDIFNFKLLIYT